MGSQTIRKTSTGNTVDDLRELISNTELFIKEDESEKKALVRMIRRKKNYLIDIGGRKQLLTEG